MKRCRDCGQEKPLDDFARHKGVKDGRQSYCRTCSKVRTYAYRAAHPERVRAISKSCRERHPDRERRRSAAWKASNPEKVKEIARRANRRQRPRRVERLRTDPVFREKCLAATADWFRRHPEKRTAQNHARRARLAGAEGRYTAEEWVAVQEYFDGFCAYCLEPAQLTMDHMEPLSLRGRHSDENIVPACLTCNTRKGSKPFILWLQEIT